MAEQIVKEKPGRRWITILAGGYLVVLYLALFVAISLFKYDQTVTKNVSTPTITITSTAHMLVHQPPPNSVVKHEEFALNQRQWDLYYPYGKLEVINGKLILQSNIQTKFIIGTSKRFSASGEKYYIQADFSTDVEQPSPYGLIFGLNRSLGAFYTFHIWPKAGGFSLLKYNDGTWHELIPYSQTAIKPYPEVNTLSVHFNAGDIELFINGKSVATYSDSDLFRSTDVGVFVNNSGYRLIVDDFFVYNEK